jgi:hypothetical protein
MLLLLLLCSLIQPNKGKRPVELPEAFQDHLHAATFKLHSAFCCCCCCCAG